METFAIFTISFFLFYLWHVMGTSIGYHRLLTHRAVACFKPVEYFWVIGGYLALEGSPVWWATMHRAHHRYADTELDPHSPRFGLKHAYNGWLGNRNYPPHLSPEKQCSDIVSDPFYAFLEQGGDLRAASKLCLIVNVLFRVGLFLAFGWTVLAASLLAGFVGHQLPLLLNVVCHLEQFGYRNYNVKDDSRNVAWLAFLTGGEAWHNNHHAHPGSARFGLRKFELDLSWFTLKVMNKLGLVQRLHEAKFSQAATMQPDTEEKEPAVAVR